MRIHPVISSNISALAHDDDETLYIRFNSGAVYAYDGVTVTKFLLMLGADSVGKFFHAQIKKVHTGRLIDPGDPILDDFDPMKADH